MQKKNAARKGGGGKLWQALKLGRQPIVCFLRPYKIGEDLFFGLGLGNAGGLSGLNAF